jgi:DNA-binding transcriptional regulator YhcF (GntR family)
MDIHVNKESEIPLYEQLSAQLVFLIGTGRLKPGRFLPSVRALAQRLAIHRNTVSRAYHDLTLGRLVERRAGRRLAIRALDPATLSGGHDLDELVDVVVTEARRRGYSLQQLHDRLSDRLRAAPPDHLLVLSEDPGMRMLLPLELRQHFCCPVGACTPDELLAKRDLGLGALVVSPQGHVPRIQPALSSQWPAIAITYSPVDDVLEIIRQLQKPSLIAVVSVSAYFLEMAQRLLAPAVGKRHAVSTHLMTGDRGTRTAAADLVVCDVVTHSVMRRRYKAVTAIVVYRARSPMCINAISAVMPDHSWKRRSRPLHK